MKTIYLDCGMGAAGDMLTAALIELLPDPDDMVKRLNELPLPGIVFKRERILRSGITGTHMRVFIHGDEEGSETAHEHSHRHNHTAPGDIEKLIRSLPVSDKVKDDATAVYDLLAQAESTVHGRPVTDIHFHEVGTLDAVADITAVCMIIEAISPDAVYASPVHVGSGYVRCSHGMLPVPAPATAELLKGIPIYGGSVQGELCTPTGAALLKHFVNSFGDMPQFSIEKTGYGLGMKEFDRLNCVRAFLGSTAERQDTICHLSCNVDLYSASRYEEEPAWNDDMRHLRSGQGQGDGFTYIQAYIHCRYTQTAYRPLCARPLRDSEGDEIRSGESEAFQRLRRRPGEDGI